MCKNTCVFKDFAISPRYYLHQLTINLHPNRELKRSRRGVLIHDRKSDQFWIDFEWILEGFWKDFGWLLASFFELYIRWVSKCDPRGILDGFWLQKPPKSSLLFLPPASGKRSWCLLGLKMAARGPKRPHGLNFRSFSKLIWWLFALFASRTGPKITR